jgi:catechol 2,3-dioxygenase-like lactoylglutathione lyase family enzyme
MLGQFLEVSIPARPVRSALEFYRSLGFKELPTGDILPWPYAPVWDGSATIGLQDVELASPALTFVRPELKAYIHPLRRFGVEFEYSQLADDKFNQAAFLDPNGLLVVLLEARTFSPSTWDDSNVTPCGSFLEFSLATHSITESADFWAELGFKTTDRGVEPYPFVRMNARGLSVGFHQTARFAPGLSYRSLDLQARIQYLKAKGFDVKRGTPLAPDPSQSATLRGPDGMPLYLLEAAD